MAQGSAVSDPVVIRFIGGPLDARLEAIPRREPSWYVASFDAYDFRVPEPDAPPEPLPIHKGTYEPSGYADELGHEMYFFKGWDSAPEAEA